MAFQIRVPASSANLGPGFDSVGLALERFLILHVQKSDSWQFSHHSALLSACPPYEEHLIYQTALKIAESYGVEMTPHHVAVTSEIPFARGLGSSASAVLAGIELANQICQLQLGKEQILRAATAVEGHPDNVAAALFGGMVVAAQDIGTNPAEIDYVRVPGLKEVQAVLYIPEFELKTASARSVLPKEVSSTEAVNASAVSNMMIASMLTGDYKQAGRWMEKDRFHEPYRAGLLPDYDKIKQNAKQLGAYATVISGAGPSMLSLAPIAKAERIAKKMAEALPTYEVTTTPFNYRGMEVIGV